MIIVIAKFPIINQGQDNEFKEWFDWSNHLLKEIPGFISRRLAKDRNGNYSVIGEFDTFKALHTSNLHKLIHEKTSSLFNGMPKPEIFEIVNKIPQL